MKKLLLTICTVFIAATIIHAQEGDKEIGINKKQEKLLIKVKEGVKPDIYVDGKKFDFPLDLLDQDKIESVEVIKEDKATKEYNAPNGVILIRTIKKIDSSESKILVRGNSTFSGKTPKIIINGKESDRGALDKLSPDEIDNIEVVKDGKAEKKYKAPDGVIIVTTKKAKK